MGGDAKSLGAAAAAYQAVVERETRARGARAEREEAAVRAELTMRVRRDLETKLEGHRGINPRYSEHLLDAAAVIAVDAFAEFYRERRG